MFYKYILYDYRDIAIIKWTNWIVYCNFSRNTDATNIEVIQLLKKTFIKRIFINGMKFLK